MEIREIQSPQLVRVGKKILTDIRLLLLLDRIMQCFIMHAKHTSVSESLLFLLLESPPHICIFSPLRPPFWLAPVKAPLVSI